MKLSDAIGNNSFLKVLIYGRSGAGKTVASTKFPLPIFIADFDGKSVSAANYWGANGKERLVQIDFETYLPSGPRGASKAYALFVKKIEEYEAQVAQGKFTLGTFIIDSVTALDDTMKLAMIQDNPGLKRADTLTPTLQEYGFFNNHFKSLIRRVLALPCNVVVVAHDLMEKDETSGIISTRIHITDKLASWLPKMFGEVYYCHVTASKDGGQYEYKALTQSSKYVTRTQIPGMPNVIPMEYNYIKDLMSKQQTETKE